MRGYNFIFKMAGFYKDMLSTVVFLVSCQKWGGSFCGFPCQDLSILGVLLYPMNYGSIHTTLYAYWRKTLLLLIGDRV